MNSRHLNAVLARYQITLNWLHQPYIIIIYSEGNVMNRIGPYNLKSDDKIEFRLNDDPDFNDKMGFKLMPNLI